MTKLLVDGHAFSSFWSVSGSATYLRGMVPLLAAEPDITVHALVTDDAVIPEGVVPIRTTRRAPEALRYFEQLARLPAEISRDAPDVFHSPVADPPRRCPVPWVQTVLDVIPLVWNAPAFRLERRLWRGRARRIRRADAVIAISRRTARDCVERLGVAPGRVHVVHLGVDADLTPPSTRATGADPYLLYVSRIGPHKGYREAFDVISILADRGFPHGLKMVGGMWRSESRRVRSCLAACGHPERIELLGEVERDQLVRLYQQASAVIVTSRCEGFGLPALEAMATGTPVVAFDNTSLPEVVGEGGILVPDGDVPAFAAAVESLVSDTEHWDEMSEAGLTQARQFSWSRCAHEHAEIFRACVR